MKPNHLLLAISLVVLSCGSDASAQSIVQIASSAGVSYFIKSDGSLWNGNEEIVSNNVVATAVNTSRGGFFIKNDGSLWAMGNNAAGHLGDGTLNDPDQPIQIVSSGVTAVACGQGFTIFLKDDGSLWGFGWNGDGELGNENISDEIMRPKKIINEGVTAIAAGYSHSLFIKSDGSLWGMGGNGCGQLGQGTNMDETHQPVEIVRSGVVSVAADRMHSMFIKSDGSLWGTGENEGGILGDCTIEWRYRPVQIVSNYVVAVAAGSHGNLFLKKDGSLWAMGSSWMTDFGEGIDFDSEKCPLRIVAPNKAAIVAGYYYNAKLKTCVSIGAGKFNNTPVNFKSTGSKTALVSSAASLPGYNLITIELLKNGDVRLTYSGDAGVNYALDRSSSLSQPDWASLVTNTAPVGGVLVMTNTPDTSKNNFWRIRAVR